MNYFPYSEIFFHKIKYFVQQIKYFFQCIKYFLHNRKYFSSDKIFLGVWAVSSEYPPGRECCGYEAGVVRAEDAVEEDLLEAHVEVRLGDGHLHPDELGAGVHAASRRQVGAVGAQLVTVDLHPALVTCSRDKVLNSTADKSNQSYEQWQALQIE